MTSGEWYEQGENACRYFAERMHHSCQESDWYQDAFGTDDPWVDPYCEPACSRMIGCSYAEDMQTCMDYDCDRYPAAG